MEINTINRKFVKKTQRKRKYTKLRMWNKSTAKSLGGAQLKAINPLTNKEYNVNFVIEPNEFEVC